MKSIVEIIWIDFHWILVQIESVQKRLTILPLFGKFPFFLFFFSLSSHRSISSIIITAIWFSSEAQRVPIDLDRPSIVESILFADRTIVDVEEQIDLDLNSIADDC